MALKETLAGARNGRMILRYSLGYRLLAASLLFGFGSVICSGFFRTKIQDLPINGLVGGFFLLVFLVMFLEVFFVEISFDREFIYRKSPWCGAKKIRWDEVVSTSFSQIGDWHVLHTKDKVKLRISRRLSNLRVMGEALLERGIIGPEKLALWLTAGTLPDR